jgi:Tfp pilus assembly protein PilX
MTPMFETRVRRLQDKYGDALLTSLTVLLVLPMFVVAPLRAAGFEGLQVAALVLIVR